MTPSRITLLFTLVALVLTITIFTRSSSTMVTSLSLRSSAFENGDVIPAKYTCDGQNISPPVSWSGIPKGAKSLALIMDDPDIPQVFKDSRGIDSFDHWTLFNISPDTSGIREGGTAGTPGVNGAGKNAYTGPCPPPQYEPKEHRYFFRLYALSERLDLKDGVTKQEVLSALRSHILAETKLIGRYSRE